MAGAVFSGNVAFVNGFVCQHRLTDDIADGVDVRHVCTHLFVNFDEAAVSHSNTGFLSADQFAVRRTTGSYEYGIVTLWLFRRICAFKSNVNAVFFRLNSNSFAVCALHQAVHHFNNIQARTQSAVNRTHFETDDATADNQ